MTALIVHRVTVSKMPSNSDVPNNSHSHSQATSLTEHKPPVLTLSKRWLTLSLIAVTLVPVTLAATVWFAIPKVPEPELKAEVFFEPVSWPPEGDDVKLMPGIRLVNPTDERWSKVSMAINKQYFFYSPDDIEPQSEFKVPLAFFRTSGNKAFLPTARSIDLLTVYAQVPGGQRAIYERTFNEK